MDKIHNCPVCGSPHITAKKSNLFVCNSCDTIFKMRDSRNSDYSTSEIYKKSIGSILEISAIVDGEEQFGTGIVVSPNGHILTCSHIISAEKENKTVVKNFCDAIIAKDKTNERIIKTEVVFSDENLDLAILYSEEAKKLPPVTISNEKTKTGERICAIGNSKGEGLCIVDGIVSDSSRTLGDNDYIVISAPVTSGYSGGPVFNTKGNIIGIIKGGRDGAVAMNYSIPSKIIYSFLENRI